jgi:hypothetical protein
MEFMVSYVVLLNIILQTGQQVQIMHKENKHYKHYLCNSIPVKYGIFQGSASAFDRIVFSIIHKT